MFQFSGLSSLSGSQVFNLQGCPIRTSMDLRSFATPHSFSQLTTSFVVSDSQGIHHTPLFASYSYLISTLPISSTYSTLSCFYSLFSPSLSMNFLSNQQSFNFYTSSVHNNCLSTLFYLYILRMHSSVICLKSYFVEDKGVEPLTSRMQI